MNGTISIVDNGVGMDYPTLKEALTLGSDTNKDREVELGIFGIGLNTAALSIGR